jgi:hypothetical protein
MRQAEILSESITSIESDALKDHPFEKYVASRDGHSPRKRTRCGTRNPGNDRRVTVWNGHPAYRRVSGKVREALFKPIGRKRDIGVDEANYRTASSLDPSFTSGSAPLVFG